MSLQRRSTFSIIVLVVATVSAIIGAFIAEATFDHYVESVDDAGLVADVTRVKPPVPQAAVDEAIARVGAAVSPSSYALIQSTDRIHRNGIVVEASIGQATALTSDGWFLIPTALVDQYGSSLQIVTEFGAVSIDKIVADTATEFSFVKTESVQARISPFGTIDEIHVGMPVFVVSGNRVYPRVLVDTWVTNRKAIQSSDKYTRHYLLDAVVETVPGALVADYNGAVIGLMDGDDSVRPLHQLVTSLEQVLVSGEILHPVLGVQTIDRSRVLTGSSQKQGLLVTSVTRGSSVAVAGLAVGDVIIRVQGQSIHEKALDEWVLNATRGDTLLLTIERDETEQEISVTL